METLEVKRLQFDTLLPDLEIVSDALDNIRTKNSIDKISWQQFDYKPDVKFSAGYTDNEILIKFYITENSFKAEKTVTNQPVYEESCVEFFVSPDEGGIYYNLEFNGIGTCLMGAGTDRHSRTKTDPDIISKIRRKSSMGGMPISERKGKISWTLTIAIPLHVFYHHNITVLKGKSFRANFYKCGDKLSTPHYLTWNPVLTERPDFHRPEYFGMLRFV